MSKHKAAILGSGNIGTDLLMKLRGSSVLEPVMMVGIAPESEGLARAGELGVATSAEGLDGLLGSPVAGEVDVVFDATSARAHLAHAPRLKEAGIDCVDLTPAAVGPYAVPVVNLEQLVAEQRAGGEEGPLNVNMVTCGGQATIPMVAAMREIGEVAYAEIVASISSRSAGPGTRANIDEFTRTTARGLESVGGSARGKAIIVLNPAEPPLLMRDTVYGLVDSDDTEALERSIRCMVEKVQSYVPGYRLVQAPVFDEVEVTFPGEGKKKGTKVSVLLEVEGAGDWLPAYAGNLDIMTAAALKMGEQMVSARVAAG